MARAGDWEGAVMSDDLWVQAYITFLIAIIGILSWIIGWPKPWD